MATSVKGVAKRLLFSLTVLASLGGCAVYDVGYGGYDTYAGVSGYDYYGGAAYPVAPVYGYRPAPFYPAPVYVPPPVLQFNYRSGGHWRHDGHGHGWRGGEHHFGDRGNWGHNRPQGGGFRGRGPGGWHGQH
jgi:hypothetical protein